MKKNFILVLLLVSFAFVKCLAQNEIDFKVSSSIKARATSCKILFATKKDDNHYLVGISEEMMKSGFSFNKNIGEEPKTKKENIILAELDITTNEFAIVRKYEIDDELKDASFFIGQSSDKKAFILMFKEEENFIQVFLINLDLTNETLSTKKIFTASSDNAIIRCRNFYAAKQLVLTCNDTRKKELSSLIIDVQNNTVGPKSIYPYSLVAGEFIVEELPMLNNEGFYIVTNKNNSAGKSVINKILNPFTIVEQYYYLNKEGATAITLENSKKYSSGASLFYNSVKAVQLMVPSGDEKLGIQELILLSFNKEKLSAQATIPIAYENANYKINFKSLSGENEGNTLSQISKIQSTTDGKIAVFMEQKRVVNWIDWNDRSKSTSDMSYGPGLQFVCDNAGKKLSEDLIKYNNNLKYQTDDKGFGLEYTYAKDNKIYYQQSNGIRAATSEKGQYKVGNLKERKSLISFNSSINDNHLMMEDLILVPRIAFGGKLKLEYLLIK